MSYKFLYDEASFRKIGSLISKLVYCKQVLLNRYEPPLMQPVLPIPIDLVGERWDCSGSFYGQWLGSSSFENSIKRLSATPI
jgi:hypothetical protein